MTIERVPYSFEHSIKRITDVIGVGRAAALFGISGRLVYSWSHPAEPFLPRIDQALALDQAYRDAGGEGLPMLEAMSVQLNADRVDDPCYAELSRTLAEFNIEAGQLTAATLAVLQANASPREIHRALVEVQQTRTKADALWCWLKRFSRRGAGSRAKKTGGIL